MKVPHPQRTRMSMGGRKGKNAFGKTNDVKFIEQIKIKNERLSF